MGSWIMFASAAVLLNIPPGPDLLYVTSTAIANGRRVGVAAAGGIAAGAMVHVIAVSLGLSSILATSKAAFTFVTLAGAAYLVFLGLRSWRTGSAGQLGRPGGSMSTGTAFRQGMLVDLFNPKSALFFLAFLPQFADVSAGNLAAQLLLLGLTTILIGLVVEVAAAHGAAQFTDTLRARPRAAMWLDRMLGTILIALGVRLALQRHA
ncbi:LysE family translocator [Sphingopyxis sp. JAI128]|uniref:LysE family translocator n=1 Tax=Sphingopyxis sp. JAI128 TaxID=2723066 RepID=UPI00160FC967|nr:LysE family translocator [Sphingopyxis sp. JAI128]MBB6426930.1 threonine/homoserine/homoserine lactone efflux protein [Sphingopyxis sp. JAI128]